ncbi:tyrosine-type recombinase/integrase [Solirubrum puertoriconensis]|uniref:Tyr recombinase domain-containing protein n=1 Tax=Solirubrum puertoriconensis TaxID=1751427 RepID=A0A9X0HJ85_SOLP1|nr:site-specific integrase [Solirubrum puertoriconensis]KUG06915.1 hypothetical protein ASU33_06210 [Solirubrum puertoriconensis]
MPATFKLVLSAKPDAIDGLYDVRLRITAERVSRFLNTGVAIAQKHWNPKATLDKENWIKTSHHDHAEHNDSLYNMLRHAKKLATAHPAWSADQLKAALKNGGVDPSAPDFIAFCRKVLAQEQAVLDEAHRKGKPTPGLSQGTIDSRRPIIEKLASWHGKPLPFAQLTEELIKKYEHYLLRDVGNAGTTTVKNLKTLHTFIREAIKARYLTPDKDPMALYEYPDAKPKRVWMEKGEVDSFETVTLPAAQHAARTVYFLQHYAHGSRIGVILRLKWRDRAAGRIRFVMDKGGRIKLVEETPELTALLDSFLPKQGKPDPDAYILPYLPAGFEQLHPKEQLETTKRVTSAINANLKRAAQKLGIEKKLSSHVARRTLATLSERVLRGDLRQVGGLLGHTNTRTTQIYLQDMDTFVVDEAARQVYQALGASGTTQVQQPLNTGEQPVSDPDAENAA